MTAHPRMNRHCGDCTLCCRLLPVTSLGKPAGQRCVHQGRGGCAVYHRLGFPHECAVWNCRWLVDDDTIGLRRPDRSGYVLDIMPDLIRATHKETGEQHEVVVIQVWVDPARPDAWRDPALLRYADGRAEANNEVLLLRYSSAKAVVAVPPRFSHTGDWQVIDSGIVTHSPSGSLLLDKLRRHRRREAAA